MISFRKLALLLLASSLQEAAATLSSGCGKVAGTSSGTKSMTVNGKTRQYILQLPANYNASTGYKLIFGYHWRDGTMNDVAPGYYGLRDLARETAIFVAPQGLNKGWANSGGEDLTFTDQMLDYITSNVCVDKDQIFSTGWSYGGAMTFELACSRPSMAGTCENHLFNQLTCYPRYLQSRGRHRRGSAQWMQRRYYANPLSRHSRRGRQRSPH